MIVYKIAYIYTKAKKEQEQRRETGTMQKVIDVGVESAHRLIKLHIMLLLICLQDIISLLQSN